MTHLITSGSLIESTFGIGGSLQPKVGNLEAVILDAVRNGPFKLRHYWREQVALVKDQIISKPVMALLFPAIVDAQAVFVPTGNLNDARHSHAAVRLNDGRVLVLVVSLVWLKKKAVSFR